jgi:hypothetical protein
MDFDAPFPASFVANTSVPDTPPMLDLRPIQTSRLPIGGYSLLDHMCTGCGSRLIQHATGFVMCSVCERIASTRDRRATTYRSLCMCGLRVAGRIGRYRCAINPDRRIADPARIVATFDGRRAFPLSEREHQHREPVVHSLAGTGRSRNTTFGVKLRKPRRPDSYVQRVIVPPPVLADAARYDYDPVQWWATPPA